MFELSARETAAALLLCLAWVALLFYPGLSGGFLFDDFNEIVSNTAIHLDHISLRGLADAWSAFIFSTFGRPVPMVSLAIDHAFWGLDPYGYKLTNLVIHLINAAGLAWLAMRLLPLGLNKYPAGTLRTLAVLIVLLWAIHPLQVSTVLYAVQRMEMMAATFIILGLVCYVAGRQRQISGQRYGWLLLGLVVPCTGLAVLCKETGLLLPGYAFVMEVALFRFQARRTRDAQVIQAFYTAGIALAIVLFAFYFWPKHTSATGYLNRDFTWTERLLTQLRVLPLYLSQIVWPDPQRYLFYYDSFAVSKSLLKPITTLAGGLLLGGLIAAAVLLRRRAPLFTLGILWFFVSHALTSNIVPLEIAFEHRNYLAVFSVLLAVTALLAPLATRLSSGFALAGGLVVIVFVSFLTLLTTATWGKPLDLGMALQYRNQDSERAHFTVGEAYWQMSDQNANSPFFTMAQAAFEKAAAAPGSTPMPEHALIAIYTYSDRQPEDKWWDDLIRKVEDGPRGPMQIRAVRTLLDIHNRGNRMDAERLMEAGIALINKPGLNPSVNYEFALLALEDLEDEGLARLLLNAGAEKSGDTNWVRAVHDALSEAGHEEFAEHWWLTRSR